MKTQAEASSNLERVIAVLRLSGWAAFIVQSGLAIATSLMVVFAISGRSFNQAVTSAPALPGANTVSQGRTPALGIGIFWAGCGVLALLFTIYLFFRLTRLAKRLERLQVGVRPKKADVLKVLRWGIIAGFIGMLLSILGGGATLGLLLAKSIAQPQGVAIYDPSRIIRSLDIFVAMANMNAIAAHFVGAVTSLILFNWLSNNHPSE